jgi:hypothetical protein
MAAPSTRHPQPEQHAAGEFAPSSRVHNGARGACLGEETVIMRRFSIAASGLVLSCGVIALAACNGASVIGGGGGSTGSTGTAGGNSTTTGTGGPLAKVDKVDIVVGVDNSRSMADKQAVLALALSDLVQSLVNPSCLDGSGNPVAAQPPSGNDACPAGSQRAYAPILDIHVGIVTSSIGGHGSDACSPSETFSCNGSPNPTNNDAGHLVSRDDACSGMNVPTYQGQGFLAWDPAQTLMPPGDANAAELTSKFRTMVLGVGQVGCGYESQLESWYRFLVDPEPYNSIPVVNGIAVPTGVDAVLLEQRAKFLRPDSLLAILMLSDEDDCSTKEYGQFYYANEQRNPSNPAQQFHMPRARQVCATNPNDPCCASCGQTTPQGCPADPTCGQSPTLSDVEDDINLRCWDQKRRFGIDFMYPVDRYVQGLSSTTIPNRNGDLVQNPLFSDLGGGSGPVRDPGLVVLSGIVGVPWQDIARNPSDLSQGFKSADELAAAQNGVTGWDVILGDPAGYVPPKDPLMIESVDPRVGENPVLHDPLVSPGSPGSNAINGREYSIPKRDDLQYACVFPILAPRDCSQPGVQACDCSDPQNDSPLCDPNNKTSQIAAKAYPSARQLAVLKGLGAQGVVSSICPSQQSDPAKADYAYRPAVRALIERVQARLKL